jgi:hypothetical protein
MITFHEFMAKIVRHDKSILTDDVFGKYFHIINDDIALSEIGQQMFMNSARTHSLYDTIVNRHKIEMWKNMK